LTEFLAIELNDAGIRAVRSSKPGAEAMAASPGYALLDGDNLLTGLDAACRARLKPRFVHNRFWEELDTTPLPRPFPRKLRHADLAHAHLEQIWKSTQAGVDEVLLAAPGWSSEEQLALILGIARSCGVPVTGMVDSAVAAATVANRGQRLLHLDLYLHRTVVTDLDRGQDVRRERIEVNDQVGLVPLLDAWTKLIAQIFIRTTRFDPLHLGETEQALYRRLPQWLGELRHRESTVAVLEAGGKEHSIELTRDHIVSGADRYYDQIARLVTALKPPGQEITLLLSHRLVELPGLEELLAGDREAELSRLPAAAAAMGALPMKGVIRSSDEHGAEAGGLPFITRLPLKATAPTPEGAASESRSIEGQDGKRAPTHILFDELAHPITSQPFVLGMEIPPGRRGINLTGLTGSTAGISRSHCSIYRLDDRVVVEDHSSYGSFVNGRRVEGKTTLAAGDRLRVGTPGVELQLITVTDSNGASQG
jgi:hypothetical protein